MLPVIPLPVPCPFALDRSMDSVESVEIGPFPSSMVGVVACVVSTEGVVVGAVVSWVVAMVGMVVGCVVAAGATFLQPQPVRATAVRRSIVTNKYSFFICYLQINWFR